jgi:hypothetical protein
MASALRWRRSTLNRRNAVRILESTAISSIAREAGMNQNRKSIDGIRRVYRLQSQAVERLAVRPFRDVATFRRQQGSSCLTNLSGRYPREA